MLRWLDSLQVDLAYSLRVLRRSPGFVAAALVVLALGIGAYALAQLASSLLFGVASVDGATYLTATVALLAAALAACAVPGLRAARTDPSRALRSE